MGVQIIIEVAAYIGTLTVMERPKIHSEDSTLIKSDSVYLLVVRGLRLFNDTLQCLHSLVICLLKTTT